MVLERLLLMICVDFLLSTEGPWETHKGPGVGDGEQLHEDGGKMLVSCPERNCQHVDHRFGHQTK